MIRPGFEGMSRGRWLRARVRKESLGPFRHWIIRVRAVVNMSAGERTILVCRSSTSLACFLRVGRPKSAESDKMVED